MRILVESATDPTRSRRVAISSTWCVPGGAYRDEQVIGGSTRAAYSVESYANPSEWFIGRNKRKCFLLDYWYELIR
jgi:hypothetical protein